MRILVTTFALAALAATAALGGGGACAPAGEACGSSNHCGRCGCKDACKMVCKIVPDEKTIKKHVWVVECEPFCPPMPGHPLDRRSRDCGEACGACGGEGCENGCGACGKLPKCVKPDCGHVRCRKVLVKKEVTCKIPCWKCVPVYACGGCYDACQAEAQQMQQQLAPPAAPAAPKAPAPPAPPKQASLAAPLPPALTASY